MLTSTVTDQTATRNNKGQFIKGNKPKNAKYLLGQVFGYTPSDLWV